MSDETQEKIVFRKANVEDVHEMVTVNLETWQSTYGKFMSTELLERRTKDRLIMERNYIELIQKYDQIYVVEADGVVIGYISFGPSEMEGYEKYGEVYTFYILEEYQGRGFGTKMLNIAFNKMKEQGYGDVVITCLWDNVDGINFYKSHGGKIVGHPMYNVYEQQFKDTIIVYNNSELENQNVR